MGVLKQLQKQIERKKEKPQEERAPTLLELWMANRPLGLFVRGLVGLIDRKLELQYLSHYPVKKPNPEIPDYQKVS